MSALLPGEDGGGDKRVGDVRNVGGVSEEAKGGKKGFSTKRFVVALLFAALADTVGAPLGEGLAVAFDILVAIVLFAVLGFDWLLLPALLIEAIPGLGLMSPTWIAAVLLIAKKKNSDKS